MKNNPVTLDVSFYNLDKKALNRLQSKINKRKYLEVRNHQPSSACGVVLSIVYPSYTSAILAGRQFARNPNVNHVGIRGFIIK